MKALLLKYWEAVRTSFWFVPSLMACGSIGLSFAMVRLDNSVSNKWLQNQGWAFTGGADGATSVLATIAGSMITIAGVVFSLTLVALSLASSQFGPRLLRNFMRDTANQVVLGTFVSTFLFCLLVLRTIRRDDGAEFVPHLSVTVGVLFAIASLGVLIYYIHHVSVSIQADQIISRVEEELMEGIDKLFPEHLGDAATQHDTEKSNQYHREVLLRNSTQARQINADDDGYLQLIDAETLMKLATKNDILIRMELRPGHYAVCGTPLALVWPKERIDDELAKEVNNAFVIGRMRTPTQDVEFTIHQLVEIAARALSPSVNDPYTAITCVDRLGSALCRLAQRTMPSPYRLDKEGQLRIAAPQVTFAGILNAAFNQIRQNARSNAAVTIRLLETITVIAKMTRRPEDRTALQRHADMIFRGTADGLPEPNDRTAAQVQYDAACEALREAVA